MTAHIGGGEFALLGYSCAVALVRGELRETLILRLSPDGVSADELAAQLDGSGSGAEIRQDGEMIAAYAEHTECVMLALDRCEAPACVRVVLARPSARERALAVLLGEEV